MVTMSTTSRHDAHDRAAATAQSWLHAPRGAPVTQADLEATPWYGKNVRAVDGSVHITPFTKAEREALPDDGRRHELLDGTLLMSPAPTRRHQRAVVRLAVLLDAAAHGDFEVFVAPVDVDLGEASVVEPDLFVAPREDLDTPEPSLPLLVVEVLSPSTRRIDRGAKKAAYARAGIRDYWIVDPDRPSLTAWHLAPDGTYRETGHAVGDQTFTTTTPFEVTFTPDQLLA